MVTLESFQHVKNAFNPVSRAIDKTFIAVSTQADND